MAECFGDEAVPLSQEGNWVSISAGATDATKVLGECNSAMRAVGQCHEIWREVSGCLQERQHQYFTWWQDAQRNFSQQTCHSGTWSIWQPRRGCNEVTYQLVLWCCPVKMALLAWSKCCLSRAFWRETTSRGWKSQSCKVGSLRREGVSCRHVLHRVSLAASWMKRSYGRTCGFGSSQGGRAKKSGGSRSWASASTRDQSTQPKHIVTVLLKGLIWRMLCLQFSIMPRSLDFKPLFICLIVAMEIQYLKR